MLFEVMIWLEPGLEGAGLFAKGEVPVEAGWGLGVTPGNLEN